LTVDSTIVHYRGPTAGGANGSSPDHPGKALAHLASGAVPVADLSTPELPLEKGVEGVTGDTAITVTSESWSQLPRRHGNLQGSCSRSPARRRVHLSTAAGPEITLCPDG